MFLWMYPIQVDAVPMTSAMMPTVIATNAIESRKATQLAIISAEPCNATIFQPGMQKRNTALSVGADVTDSVISQSAGIQRFTGASSY